MTALLSILGLLAAWAILANLERIPWPPQRYETLYDCGYWQAVKADSLTYLRTHSGVSAQIRTEVESTIAQADQRLQRLGGT